MYDIPASDWDSIIAAKLLVQDAVFIDFKERGEDLKAIRDIYEIITRNNYYGVLCNSSITIRKQAKPRT